MLVLSHSDWPPTGHSDLNIGKQLNLRKAPPLRESKFILVGDNIATIGSCMTNNHPHTLSIPSLELPLPTLPGEKGTMHLPPAKILTHHITGVPASNTVYTPLQAWHYKIRQCNLSDMTCIKQTVPKDVGPWVLSLSTSWPCTSLQQPCSRCEQITPDVQCLNSEWDP